MVHQLENVLHLAVSLNSILSMDNTTLLHMQWSSVIGKGGQRYLCWPGSYSHLLDGVLNGAPSVLYSQESTLLSLWYIHIMSYKGQTGCMERV